MTIEVQENGDSLITFKESKKVNNRKYLYNRAVKARYGVKPSTYAKRTAREKKLIWERLNYAKLYNQHKEYRFRKAQKLFNSKNQARFKREDELLCVDNQINSENL